jgi:transcription-repair coupling factor (superfamily II helicase)
MRSSNTARSVRVLRSQCATWRSAVREHPRHPAERAYHYIGFDLYCSLLKQAVAQLKGDKVQSRLEVIVRLDFVALREAEFALHEEKAPAFLPTSYIAESQPRIQAYRRLNEITTQPELDALRKAWRDRFGRLPEAAENLLLLTELKISAFRAENHDGGGAGGSPDADSQRPPHPDRR